MGTSYKGFIVSTNALDWHSERHAGGREVTAAFQSLRIDQQHGLRDYDQSINQSTIQIIYLFLWSYALMIRRLDNSKSGEVEKLQ